MRLQLIAALLAWSANARAQGAESVEDSAPGDGDAGATLAVYADDDRTTVVTSIVTGRVKLPAPVIVETHALVDAVTSASVDVVSAATPKAFSENRIELGAKARTYMLETNGSLGYTSSAENDWRSDALQLGLSREVADKNATITIGYGFTRNRVGRTSDPNFERRLGVHVAQLGLAQVLDRHTLLTFAYTFSRASGYQASPYRFVTSPTGVSAPESVPELRARHAVSARVLRSLGRRATIDGLYRFYADDWGVKSHTVEVALTVDLNEDRELELRLRARGYSQGHAAFYHPAYEVPARYMTVDRELSTFWDVGGGARVGWFKERWDIDLKIDGIYYRFQDYPRLAGRVALVTGIGGVLRW